MSGLQALLTGLVGPLWCNVHTAEGNSSCQFPLTSLPWVIRSYVRLACGRQRTLMRAFPAAGRLWQGNSCLSTTLACVPVADGYLATALRAACPDSETKPGHRNQMGSLKTKDPSEVAKAWLGLHQCSALRCVHTFCCNSTSGLQAQSASTRVRWPAWGLPLPSGFLCVQTSLGPFCPEGFSSSYSHGSLSLWLRGDHHSRESSPCCAM